MFMSFGRQRYVGIGVGILSDVVHFAARASFSLLNPNETRDVEADALILVVASVGTTVQVARHPIVHLLGADPCTMNKYVASCFDRGACANHPQLLGRNAEDNIMSRSVNIPSAY